MKAIYACRDNVRTKEEFERTCADRTCVQCDPTGFVMPHPEAWCPLGKASQDNAEKDMGKFRTTRNRERVAKNYERLKAGQAATLFQCSSCDDETISECVMALVKAGEQDAARVAMYVADLYELDKDDPSAFLDTGINLIEQGHETAKACYDK